MLNTILLKYCIQCESQIDQWSESKGNTSLCRGCYAAYKRHQAKTNDLARRKQIARSKARYALKIGLIFKHPCSCGSTESEMHHPDYDKPLDVIWYCGVCHGSFHSMENKALNLA